MINWKNSYNIYNKGLFSIIHKESLQINKVKINPPVENGQESEACNCQKTKCKMANKQMIEVHLHE